MLKNPEMNVKNLCSESLINENYLTVRAIWQKWDVHREKKVSSLMQPVSDTRSCEQLKSFHQTENSSPFSILFKGSNRNNLQSQRHPFEALVRMRPSVSSRTLSSLLDSLLWSNSPTSDWLILPLLW